MVDAPDSKSGEGNLVRVRVSPALPTINKNMKNIKNLTAIFSLFLNKYMIRYTKQSSSFEQKQVYTHLYIIKRFM